MVGRDCIAPGLGEERGVQASVAEAAAENSSGAGVLRQALAQYGLGNTLSLFLWVKRLNRLYQSLPELPYSSRRA